MIYGIGIDMIEVERVQHNINRNAGFKEMIFSPAEIEYCESSVNKYERFAARFAAKEAFFKALGSGWAEGTQFNEVQVLPAANGKPELVLNGRTKETVSALGRLFFSVSLSHLKNIATAIVIIEQ